jgi:hypothetical protein
MKKLTLLMLLINSFFWANGQEVLCFMSYSIFDNNNFPMQIAAPSAAARLHRVAVKLASK